MSKHIECITHSKKHNYISDRDAIKELLYLLDHNIFEGEDDDELFNQIELTVQGYTAHIGYFCPNTWDYVEKFCYTNIGFLIMSGELYEYPYYKELLDRCTAALKCTADDLDVF